MAILPDDAAQTTLVHELVDAAARDLKTYRDADDPNRRAAGEAALRSIDAASRALQTVRATLANEMYGFDQPAEQAARPAGLWAPGNSGPGY